MKVLITDYVWPDVEIERRILRRVGAEVVASPSGTESDLARLAVDCDAIMTCFAKVTPKVVAAATRCVHIARYGIGVDNIAVDTATELGILVTNVPAFCVDEVAEHTLGLLLACARKIPQYDRAIKSGSWDLQAGKPLYRVKGRTLGIVGFGKIGRALAEKAAGLGLRILVHDPYLPVETPTQRGTETCDLPSLLRDSDFVSVHVPLTADTKGLIGEAELRRMKASAYLINTSRGGVLDVGALARALRDQWIAGAALDVLPQEPPPPSNPLLSLDNVILTPHASFYSEESLRDLQTSTAEEVARVLAGEKPHHVVNPEVLPRARAPHLRPA